MGLLKEFRDFAVKGNAVDMAVGIIIGAAFGKVVTSLVNDLIMPPIGKLLGGANFSNYFINLSNGSFVSLEQAKQAGAATINYGLFLNNILDFLIVAFCIFVVVKQMNRLKRTPPAEPTTKSCPQCLSTIPLKAVRCAYCTSPVEN